MAIPKTDIPTIRADAPGNQPWSDVRRVFRGKPRKSADVTKLHKNGVKFTGFTWICSCNPLISPLF